ncbi:hypothetical protein BDR22DRAFT_892033 [Usnea florida]
MQHKAPSDECVPNDGLAAAAATATATATVTADGGAAAPERAAHVGGAAQQQRSAFAANFGYSNVPLPIIPPQSYPSYPAGPWQPQPMMPPMAMGFYPYPGAQYQPSLPLSSQYAGGFAAAVLQGMLSDTSGRFGGSSRQASRRGGPPRSNRGRSNKRSEKKRDEKKAKDEEEGEKQKEKKAEKERGILAPVPSGVQKAGKNASRNAKLRQKKRERKGRKRVDESGEGEEEDMSGVEATLNPENPSSGPPPSDSSGQQVADARTALATESQTLETLAGAENVGNTSLPSSSHRRVDETPAVGETEEGGLLLQQAFGDLSGSYFEDHHSQGK